MQSCDFDLLGAVLTNLSFVQYCFKRALSKELLEAYQVPGELMVMVVSMMVMMMMMMMVVVMVMMMTTTMMTMQESMVITTGNSR